MLTLGIDGLIAVAGANGLVSYSTAIGPGAEGLTCFVTLVFADREVTEKIVEPKAAAIVGGVGRVWREWPQKMLTSYAVNQAIRKHFKDVVEAAERGLDSEE
jgi:hypothetical protein